MEVLKSLVKSESNGSRSDRVRAEERRLEKTLSPTGLKWFKPRPSAPNKRLTHVSYFQNWFQSFKADSEEGKDFLERMITRLEKVSTSIPKNLKRIDLRKPTTQRDSTDDSPRLLSPSVSGRLRPSEIKFINENYPYPAHSRITNRLPLPTNDVYLSSPKSLPPSNSLTPSSTPPSLEVFQRIYHQTKAPAILLRTVEKPSITEVAIKLHWTLRDTTGSRPESREGAGFCVWNQRVYLFGGLSMTKRNDTRMLDTHTWTWTQLQTQYPPKGRIGHTIVYYRKQLLVFGGWSNYSQRLGVRRCYKKIYSLGLEGEMRWQRFRGSGKVPKSRRYHCSAVFGGSMLIYGGVDTQCKVLKGLNVLLLETLEWVKPKLGSTESPGSRCNSSLTTVFHSSLLQRDDFTIFCPPKQRLDLQMPNSGFYLFGGLDEEGALHNDLWVLTPGEGFVTWKLVETSGVQPIARSDHSAIYVNGYLVLYGGRNDSLYAAKGDASIRDVSLLNMTTLRWEVFKPQGHLPAGRWGHCAAVMGSRMLVLGGISTREFLPADLFVLETDQFLVKELVQTDMDRKKIRRDGILM